MLILFAANNAPFNIRTQKNPANLRGLVSAPGFEPGTVCLEGRCSIQLSYAPICNSGTAERCFPAVLRKISEDLPKKKIPEGILKIVGAAGFEPATSWSQTRRDDRTTLRPEFFSKGCGGCGIRTHATLAGRQFSKLLR